MIDETKNLDFVSKNGQENTRNEYDTQKLQAFLWGVAFRAKEKP